MTEIELVVAPPRQGRVAKSSVLYDALGPRGRRRVLILTIIATAVIVGFLIWFIARLGQFGHLQSARWSYVFSPTIMQYLGEGLLNNLKAAGIAGVLTLVIGLFLALGRLSTNKVLSAVSVGWIEFFRGFPLLLLIVFPYLLFPTYFQPLPAMWYVVIGLTLYNSAVMAEIYRAGILSLARGQREAAYAVGLTHGQAMRLVVLPQAIRRMIPLLLTQMVILFKDSTLGYFVTYQEALRRGELVGAYEPRVYFQAAIVTAITFFLVSFAMSRAVALIERRTAGKR